MYDHSVPANHHHGMGTLSVTNFIIHLCFCMLFCGVTKLGEEWCNLAVVVSPFVLTFIYGPPLVLIMFLCCVSVLELSVAACACMCV